MWLSREVLCNRPRGCTERWGSKGLQDGVVEVGIEGNGRGGAKRKGGGEEAWGRGGYEKERYGDVDSVEDEENTLPSMLDPLLRKMQNC